MNNVLQYRRERLPGKLVLTVAFLLTLAGALVSGATNRVKLALDLMLAVLLVSQFRLWDDLQDVDSDRIQHPDRVLCRQTSLRPFRVAVAIMFVVNVTSILASGAFRTAIVFAGINLVFYIWYNTLRSSFRSWANSILVLTKYPAFLFVLVDGSELRDKTPLAIAMIVVFSAACIYEVLHNLRIWLNIACASFTAQPEALARQGKSGASGWAVNAMPLNEWLKQHKNIPCETHTELDHSRDSIITEA